mgnify:FL=1
MKNLILILIATLTSITLTSQTRFNYMRWVEDDTKEDSTGIIYFTSDPDTVFTEKHKFNSCIIYEFDNENEVLRYIPVNRIKVKKDEVVYLGKWENRFYKMTYNKIYGDFIIKERALRYKNKYTLYFHRDYDYYDQLTGK